MLSPNFVDFVIGLGEIGKPIYKILNKSTIVIGYDMDSKKMNKKKYTSLKNKPISFIHICIPFTDRFIETVIQIVKEKKPQGIVIHSTVSPHTTEKIQNRLNIPVIYSATRGVHKRMIQDIKRYVKFFSVYEWAPRSKWATNTYVSKMKNAGIKTKKMSDPLTLELAKIVVDTSYYGWLITYAQLSNMIAIKNKVDYDEMWTFAEEIHKVLGNRPKMFPGFIGGHCVIPNLDLIGNNTLNLIDEFNNLYSKKVKKAKLISKKYVKGKQSKDRLKF